MTTYTTAEYFSWPTSAVGASTMTPAETVSLMQAGTTRRLFPNFQVPEVVARRATLALRTLVHPKHHSLRSSKGCHIKAQFWGNKLIVFTPKRLWTLSRTVVA